MDPIPEMKTEGLRYGPVTIEPHLLFNLVSSRFDDEGFDLVYLTRERDSGVERHGRHTGSWNGMFASMPEEERNYRRILSVLGEAFKHELRELVRVNGQRRDPHEPPQV